MNWLKVVRGLRVVGWIAAGAFAAQACIELRYTMVKQDTAFQQNVAGSLTTCWLITTAIIALAADRVFELAERGILEKAARKSTLSLGG